MIYDIQSLKNKYYKYTNINQKIALETKNDKIIRVKRGLYSDDLQRDAPIIANVCNSPSYISFEYALSYYGLIPEYVSVFTSAICGKKNNKKYQVSDICFQYNNIPVEVFSKGITFFENENKMRYKIAKREKALCDLLYSMYPVRSIKDLKVMLFEDLRIDYDELIKLDFNFINEIIPLYGSNTLHTFSKYINEELLK